MSAFSEFLISDEYLNKYRFGIKGSTPPDCLLDIVEAWVVDGNATKVCPTYELFLLTVIDIIDAWAAEDRTWVHLHPLWPDKRLGPLDDHQDTPGRVIPAVDATKAPKDDIQVASHHAVLRRENFLLYQVRKRAMDRDQQLRDLLEQHGK